MIHLVRIETILNERHTQASKRHTPSQAGTGRTHERLDYITDFVNKQQQHQHGGPILAVDANHTLQVCCCLLLLETSLPPLYFCGYIILYHYKFYSFPCGLVVRIPGFHPGGPGSIPGMGTFFFLFFFLFLLTGKK